jgi:hypothetical protein
MILVGNSSYACTYKGQTFSWGIECFLTAVEQCAKFEQRRREEGR